MTATRSTPPAPEASADGARGPGGLDGAAMWRLATGVFGQTALLTALLVFFGWARTQATFAYFGVDLGLLNFSTTDYVLRSVNSAYNPLLLMGLGLLAAVLVHQRIARSTSERWSPVRIRRVIEAGGWIRLAVGTASLLFGSGASRIGTWVPDEPGLAFAWLPATITAGPPLLLHRPRGGGGRPGPPHPPGALSLRAAPGSPQVVFALAALLVLGLFWTVSLLAVHDGRARAEAIERDPGALAEVSLLSRDALVIQGPGVSATNLRLPHARYRRSYSGLRLLAHADGKYFLIPMFWRRGVDRVYSVPDDADVRIELIAH